MKETQKHISKPGNCIHHTKTSAFFHQKSANFAISRNMHMGPSIKDANIKGEGGRVFSQMQAAVDRGGGGW